MTNHSILTTFVIFLLGSCCCHAQDTLVPANESGDAAHEEFFQQKVLPILRARCWDCHGEDVQESGLRLDSPAGLKAGGSSGETIAIAGDPAASYLLQVLQYDGGVEMPPDEQLPAEEIEIVRRWIAEGLHWPVGEGAPQPLTKEEKQILQRQEHWAFQPITTPELPPVRDGGWVTEPLDQFILAGLEQRGLTPSAPADRYTLIRRLKFDLLGLPPTMDEVAEFVADTSPGAVEKLVDRYLSSPHYGERWGRHWMDVARYADTKGYAFTRDRRYPFAYTYRDYVIRALNEDVPFDEFILEQLAADLLDKEPNDPDLAALGFLTVGRKYNNRHLDIDDQIDVVGRGLLGLTVACARCHDHKYDPIPTDDYYSLYGVFASSSEPDELPIIGDPAQTPGYEEYRQELDRRRGEVEAFVAQKRDEIVRATQEHAADYLARAITGASEKTLENVPFIKLKGEQFRSKLVPHWRKVLAREAKSDHPVLGPLFELVRLDDESFAEKAPAILEKWKNTPTGTEPGTINPLVKEAIARETVAAKLDLARIFGQLLASAIPPQDPASDEMAEATREEAVPPEVDAAIRQLRGLLDGPGSLADISLDEVVGLLTRAERNTHRELEKKVESFQVDSPGSPPRAMIVSESASPHDPRVFVRGNPARPGKTVPRQFLFAVAGPEREPFEEGSGRLELARSIIDPTNPLTARVIVNRVWMHHFGTPLVRTPSDFGTRCDRPEQAELLDYLASQLIRDGWSLKSLHRRLVLSSTYRQASTRRADCEAIDPENACYWRMNARRLEFEAMHDAMLAVAGQLDLTMGGKPVKITEQPFPKRRAVYGFIDRQDLPGLYRVFDLASPDQSCPRRPSTTVPQQALYFMNSPFVIQCAANLVAMPPIARAQDTPQRVAACYRAVFARLPTDEELRIGVEFIDGAAKSGPDAQAVWRQYAQLLMMSNAFLFVD